MSKEIKWTKSVDSRYISGEDLRYYLGGLEPEMVVYLYKSEMGETYDANSKTKDEKVILYFKTFADNKPLKKELLLQKLQEVYFLHLPNNFMICLKVSLKSMIPLRASQGFLLRCIASRIKDMVTL